MRTLLAALIVPAALMAPPAGGQVAYLADPRPAPGASACPDGLCQPWALARTARSLRDAGQRRREPVRILQIGDSHTAGERISAALQTGLQIHYGFGAAAVFPRGEVGATWATLERREDGTLRDMIGATRPELIIVAFGVNDGFAPDITAPAFEARMRTQITRLRALAPGAEVLVLGAPEGLGVGRGLPCGPDAHGAPPALGMVRDVQGRVAAATGVAFWDWFGRMGGACSAERLAQGSDPLMRADRVHFTASGADWIGRMLASDMAAAMDRGAGSAARPR